MKTMFSINENEYENSSDESDESDNEIVKKPKVDREQ